MACGCGKKSVPNSKQGISKPPQNRNGGAIGKTPSRRIVRRVN